LLKKASLPYCARSEVLIAAIMKFTVFWWRRAVWWIFTSDSGKYAVIIFKAEEVLYHLAILLGGRKIGT
jgi:hypothetical protein